MVNYRETRNARGWEMNDFDKFIKNIFSSMTLII